MSNGLGRDAMNTMGNNILQQAAMNVGQGFQPQEFKESLAETVRIQALRNRAKTDVLEYMEAQLNLDLFSNPLSADLFERAMRAALAEINKL